MEAAPPLHLHLHPQQYRALQTPANEILYGGAAGGGKSHLMRVLSVVLSAAIPGLRVYLFRRVSPDLIKNHLEGPGSYPVLLGPWIASKHVEIVAKEIRFWNGSKIFLCHCADEKDRFKYQGAEIHLLLIDEGTHFTETIYRFLRGRCRAPGLKVPPQFAGMFPRIVVGSNPGGVGHQYFKGNFVDAAPPYEVHKAPLSDGGMTRTFIPARLEDNPTQDADYAEKLMGLGSIALVKAMLEGDWNSVEGAFFTELTARHVLQPFAIPPHWTRFRALDWGSAKPFSVGWYAVSDGACIRCFGRSTCAQCSSYPKGALIQYREWYGGENNKGLKLTVEAVAKGIKDREDVGEKLSYSVADPAIFASDGGPSHSETFSRHGVHWQPADNSRVAGWEQLRSRLLGDEEEGPMLYFFETCRHLLRTLPAAQHDLVRPEDIDTDGEDHALDQTRYAVMSRPWIKHAPKGEAGIKDPLSLPVKNLFDAHLKRSRNRR